MIALIAGPRKPPRSVQGLGLPCLAAALEAAGFRARIFDLYPDSPPTEDLAELDERLAEVVAQAQPVLVGMTIHTPFYADRVRLAAALRARLPTVLLVAGGHHPTAEPEHLLKTSKFDVCVVGEGEQTLVEIARGLCAGGRRDAGDWLRRIPGVVFKQEGEIVRTPARSPQTDGDAYPRPAHHLLGLEKYAPHPTLGVRSQGVLTYRGCPQCCVFCLNPLGHKVRSRTPARVVAELEYLVDEFGVSGFNFYDNLFGLNRAQALAMCEELIRRRLEIVWEVCTAGDVVDPELAGKMKAAGCIRAGFGAESGDDEVLRRSRRGFTTRQHQAGISALKAAGIKVQTFFMVGLPGESPVSVRRTVEFARRCGADEVCLSLHRPYPGTAVWRVPDAFGLRLVKGPNFEAYVETDDLPRRAMLTAIDRAVEELRQAGVPTDCLRHDEYGWE